MHIFEVFDGSNVRIFRNGMDPLFEKNHYVYPYYTAIDKDNNNTIINRAVRFTDVNNTAYDMITLLDNIPGVAGYHSGGAHAFGPYDKLYITMGDSTNSIISYTIHHYY
jgi:glucose/arabinose dehydrogenase